MMWICWICGDKITHFSWLYKMNAPHYIFELFKFIIFTYFWRIRCKFKSQYPIFLYKAPLFNGRMIAAWHVPISQRQALSQFNICHRVIDWKPVIERCEREVEGNVRIDVTQRQSCIVARWDGNSTCGILNTMMSVLSFLTTCSHTQPGHIFQAACACHSHHAIIIP